MHYSNAVGFSNSAVQIGLYLVGETDNIASGGRDAEIIQMADFFKALPYTAFYLRVGYELMGSGMATVVQATSMRIVGL